MRKLLSLFGDTAKHTFQLLVVGDAASSLPPGSDDWVVPVGRVDALDDYFQMADIAINPVMEGGGTNIKMLDYMGQTMPIVSTPIGARGLHLTAGVEAEIVEIDVFPDAIRALIAAPERQSELAKHAWKLAQLRFSWQPIAAKMAGILDQLIQPSNATRK
jgi:glycosyltransferase involved in cell wall biosynthesis